MPKYNRRKRKDGAPASTTVIAYPPGTRVSFQHSVRGLIHGVISRFQISNNRRLTQHPQGILYTVDVMRNGALIQYMKQPSALSILSSPRRSRSRSQSPRRRRSRSPRRRSRSRSRSQSPRRRLVNG
jgi:hypothetical protein